MMNDNENSEQFFILLLKVPKDNTDQQQCWWPKLEKPGTPETYTPIQAKRYQEFVQNSSLRAIPNSDISTRVEIMAKFFRYKGVNGGQN